MEARAVEGALEAIVQQPFAECDPGVAFGSKVKLAVDPLDLPDPWRQGPYPIPGV